MNAIDQLWQKGKTVETAVDPYTFIAVRYSRPNYKLFDISSLRIPSLIEIPYHVKQFITGHKQVLGIANLIGHQAVSIVFRDLEKKDFCTYAHVNGFCYGLGDLQNLSYGDTIILVEGLKDRDALAQLTSNVVAVCGSTLSLLQREILCTITNKFIILYDNDDTGHKQSKHDEFCFKKSGCEVTIAHHPSGVKDAGTIVDQLWCGNSYDSELLQSYYKSQLRILGVK